MALSTELPRPLGRWHWAVRVAAAAATWPLAGVLAGPPSNDTCGGCTAFVRHATLDYWWPADVFYTESVIITNSKAQTYTITSAPPLNTSGVFDIPYDFSFWWSTDVEASTSALLTSPIYYPSPVAAATSWVTVTSMQPVPTQGPIPSDWQSYFWTTVGLPAITPAPTITLEDPTASVYYTEYEIESGSQVLGRDGRLSCSRATSTHPLPEPTGFLWTGDAPLKQPTVEGSLPKQFVAALAEASCGVSTFQAQATLVVGVHAVYNQHHDPMIIGAQTTESVLALPTLISSTTRPSPVVEVTTPVSHKPDSGHVQTTQPRPSSGQEESRPTSTKAGGKPGGGHSSGADPGSDPSTGRPDSGNESATHASKPVKTPVQQHQGSSPQGNPKGHAVTPTATPKKGQGPGQGQGQGQGQAPPPITIGGHTITPNAATQFSISGQTLTPGGTITVSGTVVALNKAGNSLIQASQIESITPTPVVTTPAPPLIIGSSTVKPEASEGPNGPTWVVKGQTLTPNGAVTIGGTTYSLPATPTVLVVNGHTQFLQIAAPTTIPATLSYNGHVYTAKSNGGQGPAFVINGQTLTPGGEVTVSGTKLSLAGDSSTLIVDGTVDSLKPTPSGQGPSTNPPVLTIDGTTYSANRGGTYTILGQTLTPGQKITVDGTTIQLLPGATAVVINGKTSTLFPATGSPKSTHATTTADFTTSVSSSPTNASGGATSSTPGLAAPNHVAGHAWKFAGPAALIGGLVLI
jgi:hypothetical protein